MRERESVVRARVDRINTAGIKWRVNADLFVPYSQRSVSRILHEGCEDRSS